MLKQMGVSFEAGHDMCVHKNKIPQKILIFFCFVFSTRNKTTLHQSPILGNQPYARCSKRSQSVSFVHHLIFLLCQFILINMKCYDCGISYLHHLFLINLNNLKIGFMPKLMSGSALKAYVVAGLVDSKQFTF